MFKNLLMSVLVVLVCSLNATAQIYEVRDDGVMVSTDSLIVDVQFYSPTIVHVVKAPKGTTFLKESLSVIKQPPRVAFTAKKQDNVLNVKSKSITVKLNLQTGDVSYYTSKDVYLVREKESSARFIPFDDAGNKTYNVLQAFQLDKDEPIYGLGQQQGGKMNQRNANLRMVQGNTEDYVPIFQSVKGYGIFWDNYSPTVFNDNPERALFRSEVGDCIDYYFMYGSNADGVIANIRELTGQAPMFPLWTYGFFQSKERYKTQEEAVDVVRKYRELKVPLDGIIQDWQYWGSNYLWNAMDFLNVDFPNPQKFVNDVHNLNAHLTISIWNSFGPQTKQYRELNAIKALMDFTTWPQSGSEKWPPNRDYPSGVRVYDPYNPAARDIYWKYLKKMHDLGLDGWWMDSSEPDHLDFKPSDMDNKTFLGSFRKVRNAFPLMTVGGVYTHQRSVDSSKRVFILTRSAFAGQQRYGANTWSGDIVSSWEVLRKQISAGLNFSLTGIPYWNSDIGGFFLWNFKKPLSNPDYRELYTRWIQFGTFCPMMRSHGADAPREIYQFGSRGNKYYDAIEKYINLRYRLLPYIYSTSWDVTANQSSMMRALVMDFPGDRNALDLNDEYMFGRSLLVHPVTNGMYVKQIINGRDTVLQEDFSVIKSKETYLPAGNDWIDFWSGEKQKGGTTVSRQTPIDIMPIYVKAGAIVPVGPEVQYTNEKKWDNLEIRIYPGADGQFTLYEDEYDNYNYEKGVRSTIKFSWNDKKKTLTVDNREGSYPGMLMKRHFNVVVVSPQDGIGMETPGSSKEVVYDGTKVSVKF